MKRLATIIDFNNIAIRAMFTCKYFGDGSVQNFDTKEECNILVRKIATDLSLIIRTFTPDRVIIAIDAKNPWRNAIYKDIDGKGYKGNRLKDEDKNWDNIYSAFKEIETIFGNYGMVVTKLKNTEADDLAVLWRNYLMKDGFDVIMVSSDKDWTQLVNFDNETKQFCIAYNPIAVKQLKKLYVSSDFVKWYSDENSVTDIFLRNYDSIKNKLKDILSSNPKISMEEIDANLVLMNKIMCGDDGDNIPSFFEFYNNGKKKRVTELRAKHIYEALEIKSISDLKNNTNNGQLKEALEKELKTVIDIDFDKRLNRQRWLVELNPELFPKEIIKSFEEHTKSVENVGYIQSDKTTMESILKGTSFLTDEHKKIRENSIFDDLKSLDKFSKSPALF